MYSTVQGTPPSTGEQPFTGEQPTKAARPRRHTCAKIFTGACGGVQISVSQDALWQPRLLVWLPRLLVWLLLPLLLLLLLKRLRGSSRRRRRCDVGPRKSLAAAVHGAADAAHAAGFGEAITDPSDRSERLARR